MRIVNTLELKTVKDTPAAIAMGFFDGVHKGHQNVINSAKSYAENNNLRLCVFSFTRNINSPKTILTVQQKQNNLQNMGVNTLYMPSFESFSALQPSAFFSDVLLSAFNAAALFCGETFTFGEGKSGNIYTLGNLCIQNDIYLNVCQTAMYKKAPISSTRIKAALSCGNFEEVTAQLGYNYSLTNKIIHGKGNGHVLGFPTINQEFENSVQTPPFGVYITRTIINGKAWASVTGYGTRPSFDNGAPSCETFIPNYSGNLYNKTVTVEFYKKIADSKKFETKEELASAVQTWAKTALNYFKEA